MKKNNEDGHLNSNSSVTGNLGQTSRSYERNTNNQRYTNYSSNANSNVRKSNVKNNRSSNPKSSMPAIIIVAVVIFTAIIVFSIIRAYKPISTSSSHAVSSNTNSQSNSSRADSSSITPISEDTVVGRFFGPLYASSNPKEVIHNDIRALYLGAAANLDKNIEIANNSTINAFVIDLKESNGIYFRSTNKLANEIGAIKYMYNIENVVKKCKENNIKLIGRIVCFKDHILSAKRPDLCIKDQSGNLLLYPLEGNKAFVSAYNKEVWQYNIDIAKEAIALGFDEIQFDYVRFPTCNKTIRAAEYFGEAGTVPTKIEAINRFLLTAKAQIQDDLGIPLSGDIFGIVLTSKLDGKLIGQDWESIGKLGIDTLSPMIYPSHYAKNTVMGGIRFANPSADTYKFLNAVFKTEKFSETAGFSKIRCYIQAYGYTQTQLFGQIRALKDNGFNEYIYWNSRGSYTLADVMK